MGRSVLGADRSYGAGSFRLSVDQLRHNQLGFCHRALWTIVFNSSNSEVFLNLTGALGSQRAEMVDYAGLVEEWSLRLQQAVVGSAIYYTEEVASRPNVHSGNGAFYDALSSKLRGSLATCVAVHAGAYPDWSADTKHVGFMVKIDGTSFLRAPVHLVPLVPEKSQAHKIWTLANAVRLENSSVIALSGSNAVRRIFNYVDDVDFFEYVPVSPAETTERLEHLLAGADGHVCQKVRVGEQAFSRPFENSQIKAAVSNRNPLEEEATIKLDFLSIFGEERPFEVSNICAFTDENFEGIAKGNTFPFQEILLSARELVPSCLDDPIQVGRYVLWLTSQMQRYSSSQNHLKAMKRAVNLCRFCWFDDILDRLHALFDNTVVVHQAEIAATSAMVEEIKAQMELWSPAVLKKAEWRLAELKAEIKTKEVKQANRFPNGFDDEAIAICDLVAGRLKDLAGGRDFRV